MVAINASLLGLMAIAFFLLFRLLLFHLYIKAKGMTTYQYILKQRADNKVTPNSTKDLVVLKKLRGDQDPNHVGDESREAVNITSSLNDHAKDNTREQTSSKQRDQNTIDPLNRTKSIGDGQSKAYKYNPAEEPTELKPKSLEPKAEKETAINLNHQDGILTKKTDVQRFKQNNSLKEDEGSFVLSKTQKPLSSQDLASELDSLKPKLALPISNITPEDKEPGEWTLRQRNNEAEEKRLKDKEV